jgi:hypothetical protein
MNLDQELYCSFSWEWGVIHNWGLWVIKYVVGTFLYGFDSECSLLQYYPV